MISISSPNDHAKSEPEEKELGAIEYELRDAGQEIAGVVDETGP